MEINKDIADLEALAKRKSKQKKFLLCYHNFNAKNYKKSMEEIDKITTAAGSPISIAVVPSIGGVPESEAEGFQEAIEQLRNSGHEILLHGARHRADLFVKRSPLGKFLLKMSKNQAEFCGLSEVLSNTLLNRALALWNVHGQGETIGFVPPSWIGNRFLKKQVFEHFDFYEGYRHVYKKSGKKYFSQILSFSVLPKILLPYFLMLACMLLTFPVGTPRLVIHTEDFKTIGQRRVLNLVRFAVTVREKVLYKDL